MTDRATDGPRPIHLAVLAGASAGIYAISLAAVAGLQSAGDQATTDERAPLEQAVRELTIANDRLAEDLERAGRWDDSLGAAYDRVGSTLDATEATLDGLDRSVSGISGAAGALPDRVALPVVPRTVVTRGTSSAHATTGASGGG